MATNRTNKVIQHLENVAVVRADGRTIQFVNIKDKLASGKPAGLSLKRGDLVAVLRAPEK